MRRRSRVTIKFNHLDEVTEIARDVLEDVTKIVAVEVRARAKQNVTNVDAVDTGNLRASIYTRFYNFDGRPNRLNIGGRFYSTKQKREIEVDPNKLGEPIPPPKKRLEAHVGVAAEYGMYIEFGTVRMAARPYLTPAATEVRKTVKPLVAKKLKEALALKLPP
jgi:HK97 gp10 family phage protein